jgi:hypothetical protein
LGTAVRNDARHLIGHPFRWLDHFSFKSNFLVSMMAELDLDRLPAFQ